MVWVQEVMDERVGNESVLWVKNVGMDESQVKKKMESNVGTGEVEEGDGGRLRTEADKECSKK